MQLTNKMNRSKNDVSCERARQYATSLNSWEMAWTLCYVELVSMFVELMCGVGVELT